jgi:hypothetical protein
MAVGGQFGGEAPCHVEVDLPVPGGRDSNSDDAMRHASDADRLPGEMERMTGIEPAYSAWESVRAFSHRAW